jgi:act minimal PKS acyl carrier protein
MPQLTIDRLRDLLREVAGEDDAAETATGDFSELTFEELGYDSLALMELATRIAKDFGVTIDDDQIAELETPAALLEIVNGSLAVAS